jgi:hypothetical protein
VAGAQPAVAPRRAPYAAPAGLPLAAASDTAPTGAAAAPADPLGPVYRAADATFRPAAELPGAAAAPAVRLAALLDSAELGLPDTARFRDGPYRGALQPEYATQPQVGVGSQGNFGQQVYGGTTIVLGDMLGNRQLAVGGGVNGRISDAQLFVGYTSLGRRLQYTTGASQLPLYFFGTAPTQDSLPGGGLAVTDNVRRFVARDAYWRALYSFDRFRRVEVGARASQIGRSVIPVVTRYDAAGAPVAQDRGARRGAGSATLFAPSLAFVHDNAIFGYTSPIAGQRLRVQIEPQLGTWRWVDALADYRRYQPILFNVLTLSARAFASVTAGRDEAQFPKFVGRPTCCAATTASRTPARPAPRPVRRCRRTAGCSSCSGAGSRSSTRSCGSPWCAGSTSGCCPITLPPSTGSCSTTPAWRGPGARPRDSRRSASRPRARRTTT